MLGKMKKNKGAKGSIVTGSGREPVKAKPGPKPEFGTHEEPNSTPTLADLGISKKLSHQAQEQKNEKDCQITAL